MHSLLNHLQSLSVLAFLVGSMGSLGLTLTPGDMLAPLRNVRFVLLAIVLNFILAPALAWLLISVIPLERGHAIGLLLLGGAAGAPFLPKLFQFARCDPGQAAALIGLLTAGTIVFLPFALPQMVRGLQAGAWSIARPLLLLIVAPLLGGMLVKGVASPFAARTAPILGAIGNASLLLLFILLIARNARALLGTVGSGAILAALIYFALLFVLGWIAGGSQSETRKVLGLSTAARNFGAALAPATSSFSDPNVAVMIIVGAIVCIAVTFGAGRWVRRGSDDPHRT